MPKNVINKIMFYTSHPVADILRESSIFRALEFDNGKRIRTHGSPFDRGDMDAYYGRGYEPHKMEAFLGRMKPHDLETENEKADYEAAYFHSYQRRFWINQHEAYIKRNFGYHVNYCIRPIWSLNRQGPRKCYGTATRNTAQSEKERNSQRPSQSPS